MTISNDSFSQWMRVNLLSSSGGLISQDIDHIFITKSLFIFAEEKFSINGKINPAQAVIYKMINDFFKNNSFFKILLIYFVSDNEIYINPNLIQNSYTYGIDIKNSSKYTINDLKNFLQGVNQYNFNNNWTDEVVKGLFYALRDCNSLNNSGQTRLERTFSRESGLKNIIKNHFSIDWIFVNYCTGYVGLFLEKINSNGNYKLSTKENFLFEKINLLFEEKADKNVCNPKTKVNYEFIGFYLIEFENTNPDNLKIWINNTEISKEDFIKVMNLNEENSKDTLLKLRFK